MIVHEGGLAHPSRRAETACCAARVNGVQMGGDGPDDEARDADPDGVLFMRTFMDEVRYNPIGNIIGVPRTVKLTVGLKF